MGVEVAAAAEVGMSFLVLRQKCHGERVKKVDLLVCLMIVAPKVGGFDLTTSQTRSSPLFLS
jgi:hypothetical protein